jgi:hypothetical protein
MFSSIVSLIVGLTAAGVSAWSSSNAADKNSAAVGETNIANMKLNNRELDIQQQNADTSKYNAHENVRLADMTMLNNKISKYPELKKSVLDIWAGR